MPASAPFRFIRSLFHAGRVPNAGSMFRFDLRVGRVRYGARKLNNEVRARLKRGVGRITKTKIRRHFDVSFRSIYDTIWRGRDEQTNTIFVKTRGVVRYARHVIWLRRKLHVL